MASFSKDVDPRKLRWTRQCFQAIVSFGLCEFSGLQIVLLFQKSTHFPAQMHPMHIFSRFCFWSKKTYCPVGLVGEHLDLSLDGFFPQLLSESTVYDEPSDGDAKLRQAQLIGSICQKIGLEPEVSKT